MSHFRSSFDVTVIGLGIAFWLGGFTALYITALLAILEVSLSFDNAVVNAKVLDTSEFILLKIHIAKLEDLRFYLEI